MQMMLQPCKRVAFFFLIVITPFVPLLFCSSHLYAFAYKAHSGFQDMKNGPALAFANIG